MNGTKRLLLAMLLVLGIFVSGCVVASKTTKGEVNALCKMSEEDKCAFAEMVAKKVIELQSREKSAN